MLIPSMPEIILQIEAFLERHAMPPSTFGREATGEPQLLKSMKDGRSPSHRVLERVAAFMALHDSRNAADPADTSPDTCGAVIGPQEPEPSRNAPAVAPSGDIRSASGRAPGTVSRDSTVPGDLLSVRPSLFDFAAAGHSA